MGLGDGEEAPRGEVVMEGNSLKVLLDPAGDVPSVAVGVQGSEGEVWEDRGEESMYLGGALGEVFFDKGGLGGIEVSRSMVHCELSCWGLMVLGKCSVQTFAK